MGVESNDGYDEQDTVKTPEQLKFSKIRPIAYRTGLSMVTGLLVENEDGETAVLSLKGKWTQPEFQRAKPETQDEKDEREFDFMRYNYEFFTSGQDMIDMEQIPEYVEQLTEALNEQK